MMMYKSMYVVRRLCVALIGSQREGGIAHWAAIGNTNVRPFLHEDPNETYFLDFVIKDKSKLSQQRLTSTDEGI